MYPHSSRGWHQASERCGAADDKMSRCPNQVCQLTQHVPATGNDNNSKAAASAPNRHPNDALKAGVTRRPSSHFFPGLVSSLSGVCAVLVRYLFCTCPVLAGADRLLVRYQSRTPSAPQPRLQFCQSPTRSVGSTAPPFPPSGLQKTEAGDEPEHIKQARRSPRRAFIVPWFGTFPLARV